MLFLPELGGTRADWAALAESLSTRGVGAACLDLRPVRAAGEARPVWGRAEDPLTAWTEAWREIQAAYDSLGSRAGTASPRTVLVGAGLGGAAAAVASSRMPRPPGALVLVHPAPALAGIPIVPILAGLESSLLILSTLDQSDVQETGRDAFLACRPRAALWMTGPATEDAVAIFLRRPQLAVDLMDWIERK